MVCDGRFGWFRGGSREGLWWLIWMVSWVLVLVLVVDLVVVAHGGFMVVDLDPVLDLKSNLLYSLS